MSAELKSGIYRHYADGRYYQVLFVATLNGAVAKDEDVDVFVPAEDVGIHAAAARSAWKAAWEAENFATQYLFTARAHADYRVPAYNPLDVAIYVPLYSDKPGRRISVRAVAEFNERMCGYCGKVLDHQHVDGYGGDGSSISATARFTYVGGVIPEAK